MTHVVVVAKETDGSIKLSKEELQKMLDDAYNRGYSDGKNYTTITYPSYPNWVYTNTVDTTPKVTL